jgi:hypothetical protein
LWEGHEKGTVLYVPSLRCHKAILPLHPAAAQLVVAACACHGVDLECSPWPLADGLASSLALLGVGGTFKGWGLAGSLQVIGDVPLKGMVELQPCCFLSFAFQP